MPFEDHSHWLDRLSVDAQWEDSGTRHTLYLFQEAMNPVRHLDMLLWFDDLYILNEDGVDIPLHMFASAGEQWWGNFQQTDPRT